tara:strand:- start:1789 stop:2760 length:972 start_codon:yes stop_codon:yes gene_type:complete
MDFLKIDSEKSFEKLSLELFNFHHRENENYRNFCDNINIDLSKINCIEKIPFLPIVLFKNKKISIKNINHEIIFESSGTGGLKSKHFIKDLELYNKSIEECFKNFYGEISDYIIIGVTPSIESKNNSSLIYMINQLIKKSNKKESQFLMNSDIFYSLTKKLERENKKYIVYGLSHALLDLLDGKDYNLKESIFIETGGMKGLRDEIEKDELHKIISDGFNTNNVHSEYAMTELLSQSYSSEKQVFMTPAWKKVLIKDFNDPLKVKRNGRGFLNIIDLANKYSCPFISTEDVGEVYENGNFKLFGRGSDADLRGCNLMLGDQNN